MKIVGDAEQKIEEVVAYSGRARREEMVVQR